MQLEKLSHGMAIVSLTTADVRLISRALRIASAEFTTAPEADDTAICAIETAFRAISIAGNLQMTMIFPPPNGLQSVS